MLYPSVGFIPLFGDKVVEDRRIRHLAKKSALFVCPHLSDPRASQLLIYEQTNSKKMKKLLMLAFCAAFLASCGSVRQVIMPRAVNTINTAPLADLNLERSDYEVLNTLTAEAVVLYSYDRNGVKSEIVDYDGEFSMEFITGKFGLLLKHDGILRLGYLQNDYQESTDMSHPEDVVRRVAIYRLINLAREHGADAVVEPTISTNVEQTGKRTITYKSTVTAKIIKLKTDR